MKYKYNNQWKDLTVKAGDTLPIGTIVDYDGDTVPTGYEQVNSYSTDEIKTGDTWIDGKPIYRQAFTGTKVSGTNLNINTNLTTIDTLVKFTGVLKSLSGYIYPLPQYESSSINYVMNINKTNGSIQIKTTTGNYSNGDVVIVLEYTKTTD